MAESSPEPDVASSDRRIGAARAGDVAAFEALYRENAGRVYALCLRMVEQPADADAVTQEVFVRAWESLAEFRGECPFSAWLHRIAVRQVLMHHRSTARRRRRVEPEADDTLTQHPARCGSRDDAMDLERAIRGLPEGARMVFVLSAIEGYAHAEIARMMGCTEATSRAHLFRARSLLREVLHG